MILVLALQDFIFHGVICHGLIRFVTWSTKNGAACIAVLELNRGHFASP